MNKHKVGLTLGSFFAVIHLGWSILVMLGVAQPFYNWILALHAIEAPMTISAMGIGGLVSLVAFTAVVGYVFGWVFALVWNWINK